MKSRKIYYVPGLISAIFIPLLFWYYGNQKLQEPIPNVIDIGLPAKSGSSTFATFEPLRNWKYQKIIVQPNTARKNSEYYVSEIKKLQARNEKNTGIEFIIGKNNTYDDFISILNDFEKAKQLQYGLDLDKTGHIFAVHFYKDSNAKEIDTFSICGGAIFEHYKPTLYEKIIYKFTEFGKLPRPAYYLIFGYLILLNVSIFSLVRKSM
ncbi:hypothetical protein [Cloacibacterium sp.]|uniref:hypothetical protein n=1 Tax=Cloacibacterium sp. TaxID=1913682 RepID=UPI0039E481D5